MSEGSRPESAMAFRTASQAMDRVVRLEGACGESPPHRRCNICPLVLPLCHYLLRIIALLCASKDQAKQAAMSAFFNCRHPLVRS